MCHNLVIRVPSDHNTETTAPNRTKYRPNDDASAAVLIPGLNIVISQEIESASIVRAPPVTAMPDRRRYAMKVVASDPNLRAITTTTMDTSKISREFKVSSLSVLTVYVHYSGCDSSRLYMKSVCSVGAFNLKLLVLRRPNAPSVPSALKAK